MSERARFNPNNMPKRAPKPPPTPATGGSAKRTGSHEPRPRRPQGERRPTEGTTAPYTFVPFAPTVPAAALAGGRDPHDAPGSFDRPLVGTLTGHIDLTITALTPLIIGGAADGSTFRWPDTTPGVPGIPGSTLHGMLRGTLAHLLGGGIGPVKDRSVYYRAPIPPRNGSKNPLHDAYRARNPGGVMGRQSIGLLIKDGPSYVIEECVQFSSTASSVAPRVRWTVVEKDLEVRREGSRPGRDAPVKALQWSRVWVVWAAVGPRWNHAARRVVVGLGRDRDSAEDAARRRCNGGRIREAFSDASSDGFGHFLDPDGGPVREPVAVPMVFVATGLEGLPQLASAYLFPIPGSDVESLIDSAGRFVRNAQNLREYPVPAELVDVLEKGEQPSQYQKDNWPDMGPFLRVGENNDPNDGPGPDGVPVFFTLDDNHVVQHLGRSGGFRIRAKRTVLDTVPEPYRLPGAQTPALHALFGNQPISTDGDVPAMAGRVSIGHARATADPGSLPSARVTQMEPKVSAWKFRLQSPKGAGSTGYDDEDASYRGRAVYHHRWPRDTHEHTHWHALVGDDGAGPQETPDPAAHSRAMAPLRSGAEFAARITFTNLAPAELGALLFALTLGNTRGEEGLSHDFAHRIGGMKSFGLGSVHIAIRTELSGPDRYRTWASDVATALTAAKEHEYIGEFLDAIGAAADAARPGWVHIPETGRSWPANIAALLLSARWTRRLPNGLTREMSLEDNAPSAPLPDVFALHPDARRLTDIETSPDGRRPPR
ncbi:RAMP superfamily CRISPR-associated protein [Pseudonocardia alni]|uniref:RAMP superfamily CRISPR-associated protein n=1 Tax=Pseudonocardia alni TaxID=33907 RepID=UPI00279F2F57|nr:hypothetical protein PaSha_12745 [Pseudonocardia alni]